MKLNCASVCIGAGLVLASCASTSTMPDSPGVMITGNTATFNATHAFSIKVPEGAKKVQAWLPMPDEDDPSQEMSNWNVVSPYPAKVVHDKDGNNFLYVEATNPKAGSFDVTTTFTLSRAEVRSDLDPSKTRPHTNDEIKELAEHLKGSSQSIIDDNARKMAKDAVGNEKNPILASRKIYDAILGYVEYHIKDPMPDKEKKMQATGTGSSVKTFETKCGNCTDFHSLYAAVSRAAGIPTREVYGGFFKTPLDGKDTDASYHCWIEFHAPNIGWIPLDVAVADVYTADFKANDNSKPRAVLTTATGYDGPDANMVNYYFGNLENRRLSWHWGRDLTMNPPQAGAPLLWNPRGYVEIDGKPLAAADFTRKFTYKGVK
ncbi:MAG: transglutaminase-like domain-containing protein [Planctomycetes bacterium]|nr:transglutaminase-like domain-containing protein [Planctomycetota bacterium]NUQ34801.1 transglutaminase domain-containing protein [Planctomycetaceae bacterium]